MNYVIIKPTYTALLQPGYLPVDPAARSLHFFSTLISITHPTVVLAKFSALPNLKTTILWTGNAMRISTMLNLVGLYCLAFHSTIDMPDEPLTGANTPILLELFLKLLKL